MSERILLSTYSVKIINNRNEQVLSHFNSTDDFFIVFQGFTNEILRNIERQSDIHSRTVLHLTLDRPAIVNFDGRIIYGFFSSGISGERFNIRDLDTNETELEVQPERHASFRNIFFYFYIPIDSHIGYLILQRKAKFGIKVILTRILNKYIHEHGFQNYYVEINNLLHFRVYERMLQLGNLKKVDLIKRSIPNSIEEFYRNDGNTTNTRGVLRTSFSTNTSLSESWKGFVDGLFRNRLNENSRIEILGVEEFDEIEFELELDGKKKIFHIVNHQRTQPDIDVTMNLTFTNDEPTLESLIQESQNLITDMLEVNGIQ